LEQLITYIGLDVHKETIAVALAEAGKRSEVREYTVWRCSQRRAELCLTPDVLATSRI
jgi:hypothetical protein